MFLYYITTIVHVFVCIILILVVLLQSGKGADLSGAFGGGATQTAFGARGPSSFLSKMTTVAAIIFMFTSVALSMMYRKGGEPSSILDKTKSGAKPAATVPAKQTQAPALTPDQIKKIQEEIEAKQKQQPAQQQAGQPQVQQNMPMGMKVVVRKTQPSEPAAPSKTPSKGSEQQPPKESKPPSK
jgi:preprotein translocase subunit SecG